MTSYHDRNEGSLKGDLRTERDKLQMYQADLARGNRNAAVSIAIAEKNIAIAEAKLQALYTARAIADELKKR